MNRQEKEQTVADLQERFAKAKAAVLTDYQGLTVEEMNTLRRQLHEVAGECRVAKNTLVKLAIEGTAYFALQDLLTGQNGLVFGYGDAIGLAKVLTRYAREHEKFTIKGGVTDGQFLIPSSVEVLARLPSQEALRAQFLGLLSKPAARLASVLGAPAGHVARVLEARKTQLS